MPALRSLCRRQTADTAKSCLMICWVMYLPQEKPITTGTVKTAGAKMSEIALMNREKIYLEFKNKVSAYVAGKGISGHEAEDIVADVFLKVYKNLDRYDETKASLSTWIYTITKNTVINYFRSRKTHTELTDVIAENTETMYSPDVLDDLADALEYMKPRDRDLIILHYYNGYTLKAIAEMMGMSYINAKVIHSKALAFLREKMSV